MILVVSIFISPSTNILRTVVFVGMIDKGLAKYSLFKSLDPGGLDSPRTPTR